MVVERAQLQPGADGVLGTADDVHQFTNQITPFIDQSQTYASDSSHQAFLREYMIGSDGQLHSTGNLLAGTGLNPDGSEIGATATDSTGAVHSQLATWGLLKASAAHLLGIKLQDGDVNSVPLLATDAYGNLILGAARAGAARGHLDQRTERRKARPGGGQPPQSGHHRQFQ